jgi:NAD(P)-dependent dehydrogenase (short-subunit alcohol dehydrogenase family)
MRMTRMREKVVLVTGAGSVGPGWGNGKAAAALYAREGAQVFAVDIRLDAARETQAIITAEGGVCEAHAADVSDSASVAAMVEACITRFGRIDVLHNNVGIVVTGGPIELDEAGWQRSVDVNLKSQFLTCKHTLPHMLKTGRGAIVNVSSVGGLRWTGIPYVAYAATKAGVIQLTQSVALQYARQGIRCNCIAPGLIDTPLVSASLSQAYGERDLSAIKTARAAQAPMGRMGDAWDVAHAALFLASDDAGYISGHTLVVDGGLSASAAAI